MRPEPSDWLEWDERYDLSYGFSLPDPHKSKSFVQACDQSTRPNEAQDKTKHEIQAHDQTKHDPSSRLNQAQNNDINFGV